MNLLHHHETILSALTSLDIQRAAWQKVDHENKSREHENYEHENCDHENYDNENSYDPFACISIHRLRTDTFKTVICALTSLDTQRVAWQKVDHANESYEHEDHEHENYDNKYYKNETMTMAFKILPHALPSMAYSQMPSRPFSVHSLR